MEIDISKRSKPGPRVVVTIPEWVDWTATALYLINLETEITTVRPKEMKSRVVGGAKRLLP